MADGAINYHGTEQKPIRDSFVVQNVRSCCKVRNQKAAVACRIQQDRVSQYKCECKSIFAGSNHWKYCIVLMKDKKKKNFYDSVENK